MQEQYSSIESVTREDIFKSLIQDDSLVKVIANTAEDFLSDKISISEVDKNGNGLSYYMFDRSDRSKDENLVNTDTLVSYDEDGNQISLTNYIVRPKLLWLKIIPHMGSDDVVLTSGSFIFFDLFDDRSTNIAKNFKVRFYVVSKEDIQSVKQYPTQNGGKTSFYRPDYICDRIQYIFAKTDNKYVGQGNNKVSKPIEAISFSGRSPFSLAGAYYGCTFTMDCMKLRCN